MNLETRSVLGHCYLDNLRCHALRFYGPIELEQFTRVTLRVTLPEDASVTTFAQVMRVYEGAQYALRLLPGVGTDTLLGAGREAAWEILESEEMEATSDFFERRIDLPDPEAEDTILEIELPENDLTPVDEVMRDGSGRFIEWLEREDQRHGSGTSPRLESDADLTETTMVLPATAKTPEPDESDRTHLLHKLPLQKQKQLAGGGGKEIRAALIRDPDTTLQCWVFRNPELTEEEVAQFASTIWLTPQSLAFIYASPRWSLSATIIRNLILSSAVPEGDLQRLLVILPTAELKALTRRSEVPPAALKAAQKALLERSA